LLGTSYSKSLNAQFQSSNAESKFLEMGCFGLGITRILASVVEVMHDKKGIVWPLVLAPYKVIIVPIEPPTNTEPTLSVQEIAKDTYDLLETNGMEGEIVLEDRNERGGFKLTDADFLGFPYIIVVGKTMIEEGKFELQIRKTGERLKLDQKQLVQFFARGHA